ncbi:hypothetical protein EYZ11_004930 [Aspergillus tanneri]|uniref:Uncharacterized protein n=1 Tax=Aspergillus tanneri TaxID=1220188 RepID=A0A4S3JJW5_9EURO|nr:hypothetical protein EYZ11_004930 [Aspergillus tanneri]
MTTDYPYTEDSNIDLVEGPQWARMLFQLTEIAP